MNKEETIKKLEGDIKKTSDPKLKEVIQKKINILKAGKPVSK